jgi:hypothetical protein
MARILLDVQIYILVHLTDVIQITPRFGGFQYALVAWS